MSWKGRLPDERPNRRFQPYIFIAAVLGSIALIASIIAIIMYERYRRLKVKRNEVDTGIGRRPDSMRLPPPPYSPGTFGRPVTSGPSTTSGPSVSFVCQWARTL